MKRCPTTPAPLRVSHRLEAAAPPRRGRLDRTLPDPLQAVTYEVADQVARITLNRPERGNGITLRLIDELELCVERADLDPAVHVILLAGNGKGSRALRAVDVGLDVSVVDEAITAARAAE
jgi:enoyl-CoA hydratase/carnithine racemase